MHTVQKLNKHIKKTLQYNTIFYVSLGNKNKYEKKNVSDQTIF